MLVARENLTALLARESNRDDLVIETAGVNGALRALLGAQRVLVLFLASNLVLARKNLSGFAHHHLGKRTEEAVTIHAIDEFLIAEPKSPARAIEIIRKTGHRFGPACQHAIQIAVRDLVKTKRDRLETRSAGLIHRVRGYSLGHAAAHGDLASNIGSSACLSRVADNRLLDLLRRNTGALQCALGRDYTHIGGSH